MIPAPEVPVGTAEPAGEPGLPAGPEREFTVKPRSHGEMVFRRFLHHRLAVGSLIVLFLVVLLALFGGKVWHYSYTFQGNDLDRKSTRLNSSHT